MERFYGRALVAREGAPMGNRNAAGPHRVTHLSVVYPPKGNPTVRIDRRPGLDVTKSHYKTYTPKSKSLKRVNDLLARADRYKKISLSSEWKGSTNIITAHPRG
jgi:hypothetical protein